MPAPNSCTRWWSTTSSTNCGSPYSRSYSGPASASSARSAPRNPCDSSTPAPLVTASPSSPTSLPETPSPLRRRRPARAYASAHLAPPQARGCRSTGSATDAVADMGGLRGVDHPDDLQFDPRRQDVEQPTTTAKQHRDLMDLQ